MNSSAPLRSYDAGVVWDSDARGPKRRASKAGFPIRIMHVLDRLDIGGTEKGIAKLIEGLEPDLFTHSVCTLRGSAPGARSWMLGADITDAGRAAAGFQFNLPRLTRIMRTLRPTIVHSRNWGGIEAAFAAHCVGVPIVVHSEHGYQMDMAGGLPLRQRLLRHAAYRCTNAIFTVSNELRDYHADQAWWNASGIGVLHNGVDGDKFCPSRQASKQVRMQLGISPEALIIGYVGRLIALKDVRTLLLAAAKLVPDIPEIHLLVVGSGPELDPLRSHVANSAVLKDCVHFTGARDDVADLLKAMDIFVLPSLMEGMSNTILEAMATGLPVIATNVGGNPEILADSQCGCLFQPGDVIGLAEILSALLRDREMRHRLGRAALELTHKEFSLEAMLARYRQLYCGLALLPDNARHTGNYVWN